MPCIVIVGGGFAGLSAARELQQRRKRVRDLHIVLVDRNNYMLFTPMLPEAATGGIEFGHITQAFREQLEHVRFELGEVSDVDESARSIVLRHPITHESKRIAYDELVFALGSAPSTMGIAGVEGSTLPLRTIADAERLRNAIVGAFEVASESDDIAERDRLLRFVIVGGGFTGVETAGELAAFVRGIAPLYRRIPEGAASIALLQAEKRLLPHLPERFGKYAARVLHDAGVDIRIGAEVVSADGNGITLKGGERYESRTIVWAAGNEPAPFVKSLGLALSKHAAIETRADFSIEGRPHLWAIGDCAAIPMKDGGTYAPLAQNAVREGPLLARNVIARLRGKKTRAFRYTPLGQMASLGGRRALAELPGGAMLTGLPAWVLWRAYYLGRLPGMGQKTRVALDWALGAARGPSMTRVRFAERGETSFEELHASSR